MDRNFANTILHSALVGDMNGVLHALTFGETPGAATVFGRPRAYTTHIAPAEVGPVLALPARPPGAPRGSELADMLAPLPSDRREAAIADHALAGNVPDFLRQLRRVTYKARDAAGADHTVSVWFTPDVLSLGCDDDFVRVPMTPSTAQRVADAFGCLLPTPRISDEVWRAAESRLQPRPLTSAREAWTTFVSHNAIIQEQLRAVPNGPVIAGHKKDIVICRSLPESPGRWPYTVGIGTTASRYSPSRWSTQRATWTTATGCDWCGRRPRWTAAKLICPQPCATRTCVTSSATRVRSR